MAFQLVHHVYSEPGFGHENEDVVQVGVLEGLTLCALADGQGGQPGGAKAARVAVDTIFELATKSQVRRLLTQGHWLSILSQADVATSKTDGAGYSTLVCLGIDKNQICGASCGDSAAFLFANNHLFTLTEKQYKNPPVGSGGAKPVGFSANLKGDWKLLVVSDGVWKYLGVDAIRDATLRISRADTLVDSLRHDLLEQYSGKLPDDFSICVFSSD